MARPIDNMRNLYSYELADLRRIFGRFALARRDDRRFLMAPGDEVFELTISSSNRLEVRNVFDFERDHLYLYVIDNPPEATDGMYRLKPYINWVSLGVGLLLGLRGLVQSIGDEGIASSLGIGFFIAWVGALLLAIGLTIVMIVLQWLYDLMRRPR